MCPGDFFRNAADSCYVAPHVIRHAPHFTSVALDR